MYKKYNHFLLPYARAHRHKSTKAEIRLWTELLSKGKMQGYVFNRQKPLGPFIFDFYCKELQLVIEVDGYSHEALEKTVENDRLKDAFVIQSGLTMMRFTNRDVQEEIEEVKSKIEGFITDFEGW